MNDILNKRRAGILLHITSLPGAGEQGDLGQEAYHFVKFLYDTGVTVWQVLPLGMTHSDGSPYQALSAHAGNPALISIDWLVQRGWLLEAEKHENCANNGAPRSVIKKAYYRFLEDAGRQDIEDFEKFCRVKDFWLDDFALFLALRVEFNLQCWNQWPQHFKDRDEKAIKEARRRLKAQIEYIKFEQYLFFRQWMELKAYANQHGVFLFGDVPIFVSYDSADVWAHRDVFKLDRTGEMSVVTGVPPDYFSTTGQRWGNPHYNWEHLEQTGFNWWVDRMKTQLEMFDIIRIDHFRGLDAAWEIPANEDTAIKGGWAKAPGKALLNAINTEHGSIPLVAEDLGIITPDVEALRDEFELPGMKILQFAFDDGPENPYLPNNYDKNCVVYTGTHDNDTTIGWLQVIGDETRNRINEYLGHPAMPLHCALIHAALSSVANLAVIPMQDILELDSVHRMNTPGTTVGNWKWRFQWDQLSHERAVRFAHLVGLFNRKP